MTDNDQRRQARRQERGRERQGALLDAAAQVFAEQGVEAASMNAIAVRAGVSPGSLYQFFPHKDAVCEALAARYTAKLQEHYAHTLSQIDTSGGLDAFLNALLEPVVALKHDPGFVALYSVSTRSTDPGGAASEMRAQVAAQIEAMLLTQAKHLTSEDRSRTVRVSLGIVQTLLPLTASADEAESAWMTAELKTVLMRYLSPILKDGNAGANG